MSGRWTTLNWTTASIAGGGTSAAGDTNKTISLDKIDIVKVKIVPDAPGGSFDAKIFKKDTLLAADLLAFWNDVAPNLYYPMDDSTGVPAEAEEGPALPYDDEDASLELHLQITNNDGAAHTYTITVLYEPVAAAGAGGYATVQEEGAGLTQRAILNFIGSSATAADDAGNTRTNVTFADNLNQIASLADPGADRLLFWDDSAGAHAYLAPGNSLVITTTTFDTVQDIRTTATPQFARIGLGAAADATALLNINGGKFYGGTSSNISYGGAASSSFLFRITGTHTYDSGFVMDATLNVAPGSNASAFKLNPTLVEAGSGVHGLLAGMYIDAPVVTVGVATVTNAAALYVAGAPTVTVTGASYAEYIGAGVVRHGGYGAGTATYSANGTLSSASDARIKDVQGPFTAGLKELREIQPVLFKYNQLGHDVFMMDMDNVYVSALAQDVMKVIPEAVGQDPKGYYSLNALTLGYAAINAIKTLDARLQELESRLGIAIDTTTATVHTDEKRIVKNKQKD